MYRHQWSHRYQWLQALRAGNQNPQTHHHQSRFCAYWHRRSYR
ncbi:Uncharacterised protein [Vibrio cholerae]|nr:Uncharacterised protein [Vibrio cholerae]CSI62252.1 Uncharacterised protein [Vibrio cholerae]